MRTHLAAIGICFAVIMTGHVKADTEIYAGKHARVAAYKVPPAHGVHDQYSALLRFAVLKRDAATQKTTEDSGFSLFSAAMEPEHGVGGSESRDAAKLLLTSLHVDTASLLDVPSNTLQLIPFNATTLRLQVSTSQPQQLHNLLASGLQFQSHLINATREVFSEFYAKAAGGGDIELFGAQLLNFHLYSNLLEIELVDPEGGRGPVWSAREIKFPTVLHALEGDLLGIVSIQASVFGVVSTGAEYFPVASEESGAIAILGTNVQAMTATDIAGHIGSRLVKVFIKLECESQRNLERYRAYLLGRHILPKTTGELQRQVHVGAGAIAVVKEPGARPPPPEFCGPGCYIPAVLWCSVLIGIAGVGFVAWGEETPEQKDEDEKVMMEIEVQEMLEKGHLPGPTPTVTQPRESSAATAYKTAAPAPSPAQQQSHLQPSTQQRQQASPSPAPALQQRQQTAIANPRKASSSQAAPHGAATPQQQQAHSYAQSQPRQQTANSQGGHPTLRGGSQPAGSTLRSTQPQQQHLLPRKQGVAQQTPVQGQRQQAHGQQQQDQPRPHVHFTAPQQQVAAGSASPNGAAAPMTMTMGGMGSMRGALGKLNTGAAKEH